MAKSVEDLLLGPQSEPDPVEDDELEDEAEEPETPDSGDDDEGLGPAGERALRARKQEIRELKRQIRELKQVKETKSAPKADEDELRASIRAEVSNEMAVEVAREKAINLLTTEFGYKGNPERGVKNLDLSEFVVDGKVDTQSLRDAVEDWKDEEPQLFRRTRSTDADEDDEVPARRRNTGTSAADLGRKKAPKVAQNPLEAALSQLVGRKELA